MTNAEKYKHIMKSYNLFYDKGFRKISNINSSNDKILIYWKDENLPSCIINKTAIEKYNELKEKYTDKYELYENFYKECVFMLREEAKKYEEDAKKEASINPKIFKIRCLDSNGNVIKSRSQYDRNTAELYGMFESDILKMCKEDVDEFRLMDLSGWHVLDQNDKIIY